MKSRLLRSALFILPLFAFVAPDWMVQPVGGKASVSFPAKPEQLTYPSTGSPAWRLTTDSSALLVTIVDLQKMGMDAAAVKKDFSAPNTLNAFTDGILNSMKGSKLVSKKRGDLAGNIVFDVVLIVNPDKPIDNRITMYSKTIFVGSDEYSLYYYEKQNKAQVKAREQFFGSFKTK